MKKWCKKLISDPDFLSLFSVNSRFGIVEPFPENIYPLEFTAAEVTCVAFDSNGVHTPVKIQFVRRDEFNHYVDLTPNDNLYFTNETEVAGKNIYCIIIWFLKICFIQHLSLKNQSSERKVDTCIRGNLGCKTA